MFLDIPKSKVKTLFKRPKETKKHRFGRLKIDKCIKYSYTFYMENKKIIGRIKECERLQDCLDDDDAQLIVVYGRRRVGKTYLVNQFFENKSHRNYHGTFKR